MRPWRRYCVDVQYAGNKFSGWIGGPVGKDSAQRHCPLGVVETLKQGFSKFVGEENFCNLRGSSRTDAGVHAMCNRFHVDICRPPRLGKEKKEDRNRVLINSNTEPNEDDAMEVECQRPPYENSVITKALNFYLQNNDLRVLAARPVDSTFRAVSNAKARSYTYRIAFNPSKQSTGPHKKYDQPWVLDSNTMWVVDCALDTKRMKEAAVHFIGERDFSAVRSTGCQAPTAIRNISSLDIEDFSGLSIKNEEAAKQNDKVHSVMMLGPLRMLAISITGNAFLYRMVRNIVSVLVKVGTGDLTPDEVATMLDGRSRVGMPGPAPAAGLFLMRVHYDEEKEWNNEGGNC